MSSSFPGSAFTHAELLPSTGLAAADASLAAIEQTYANLARYNEIHIGTDRHTQVMAYYDRVLAAGTALAGRPQLGGRILGPSGSGKTTAARFYRDMVEARGRHHEGEQPVLVVPLDRACTSRRLFRSILVALGDNFADRGTEEVFQQRAYMALRRKNVRLLVIDEIQHLTFRSSERNDTTDTLKRVLDDALCPLMFIGTDDATAFLNHNKQLANRLHPPCDLPPLKRHDPNDQRIFKTYVTGLDRALVEKGLTRRPSKLSDSRALSCLFEVSGGVLGRVSNLVRVALENSLLRQADFIEVADLSAATASWAVAQDFIDYDPFRAGVRHSPRMTQNGRTA